MLNNDELRRYNRHLILPEFGLAKQELLKNAKVLVVGAGGLGCPNLAAAGVGTITIIDADTIDISNLQRQVLYTHKDIGKSKALTAAEKLRAINPYIQVIALIENFDTKNCLNLVQTHDLVVDGCDNFATRYLVNDACVISNKPFIFGSIFKFEGQVSVFNYKNGPTYRCVYPEPPSANEVPNCSEIGVIGILPGIIGTLQATEAIKIITNIGTPLSGRLLIYDALSNFQTILEIQKNDSIHITQLLDDYEAFCGVSSNLPTNEELSPTEVLELVKNKNVQIIDVREPWEYEICKLENSLLIPLQMIPQNLDKISKEKAIVIYCHHGIRSLKALEYLKTQGFGTIYNLSGGIHRWAIDIDSSMEKY
jgi:sulfur-carrier protein adenylyltransferase/sulfurtransferase